jgi:hypothetical protein
MKHQRVSKILLLIFASLALSNAACSNIFKGAASKTSDQVRYEDALKAIDAGEWATAIAKFELLSPDFAARQEVIEDWAGALAGHCGMDFVAVLDSIGSGGTLLQGAMNSVSGVEVNPGSCILAQTKMEEISALASQRTASQNLFMLVLGLGKIGAYLRADADRDGTGNLGDGSKDASFDACAGHEVVPGPPNPEVGDEGDGLLSANELNQMITGFGLILLNFSAIADDLSGGTGDALEAIDTACSALVPNPCNITDTTAINDQTRYTFAAMIHSGSSTTEIQIGIGACNGALAGCCGQ